MVRRICGYCKYPNKVNKDTAKLICPQRGIEVSYIERVCDDFHVREDILMKNAVCGVCEYLVWIEYCGKHKKYVKDNETICDDFIPCTEYCKGQLL